MTSKKNKARSPKEANPKKFKKKTSVLVSDKVEYVDYKDVNLLRRFMSERAKIRARRVTGNNTQQQREIARAIRGFTVVVTKSTVPLGTGDEIERIIRSENPDAEFAVVSNPEFMKEGAAIEDFMKPDRVVIGVNALDYSGYPDCRPEFIAAFEALANLATKAAVEGESLRVVAPLIALSKAEIIQAGIGHGVDFALTVSCYQATDDGLACGQCDACRLRRAGFEQAGVSDPTPYVARKK